MDKNEVKITVSEEKESSSFGDGVHDKKEVIVDNSEDRVNFVEKKEVGVVVGGGEVSVSKKNKVDEVRTYAGDDVWVRSDGVRVKYCDACLFEVLEEEWSYRNVCIDCEHRWSIESDPGWLRRKRKYDAGESSSSENSESEATSPLL